ncbi:MAG: hypothetical protein INR72_18370 [Williamsia herbipolensis]|nr:hypothetical protein [Williamsia herbipolensis]
MSVHPSTHAPATYGGLPRFIKKAVSKSDRTLVGSAIRPALTVEGEAATVRLAGGTAWAEVVGPQVPGEGTPYVPEATTCTWVVHLRSVDATVPVRASDFSTIDHLGTVYHPTFVPGAPKPPATLTAGQTTTFELRVVMPTGEGLMRWAPGTSPIVASWDFEVEND